MIPKQYPEVCYIWVIGAPRSGKSAIMCRWYGGCIRREPNEYPGCYLDDGVRRGIMVEGIHRLAEFYEFYETDKPTTLELTSFRNSNVVMITYSIDNKESFDRIPEYLSFTNENHPEPYVTFIVGCKCENETSRVITKEQGTEFAKSHNCHFMEVSAHEFINESKILEEILIQAGIVFPNLLENRTPSSRRKCILL